MTEFFKNNRIALRHCLLYEFVQGKCAEKAFVDVSQTVGKNVMNKEEIQILFRRFAIGKFYKNSKKHDPLSVKDIFRNDKKALRTCILYLSLKSQKKTKENRYLLHTMNSMSWHEKQNLFRFNPSFVMYEEFRKVFGKDLMEYREFDFWFYRFLNGMYNLNFERDNDKKIYELLDMPIDIMKNIVDYLDVVDRTKVRRTSKAFRSFIDSQPLFLNEISFRKFPENCRGSYSWRIEMVSNSNRIHSIIYTDSQQKEYPIKPVLGVPVVDRKDYKKCAMEHLKLILQTPNLHSEHFAIETHDFSFDDHVDSIGECSTHNVLLDGLASVFDQSAKPYIKSIDINSAVLEPIVNFLSYLKPGYLNCITLYCKYTHGTGFSRMLELEQFKQAKEIDIPLIPFAGSIRDLLHLDSFSVSMDTFSAEDFCILREVAFKSSTFEHCQINIEGQFDFYGIRRELDSLPPGPRKHSFRHLIPNTEDCFEITLFYSGICVFKNK